MLILKLKIFIKSLLFHICSGFPKSSQQQIDERYMICIVCDKFSRIKSECSVCGCSISKKKKFLNKLAWADQECPVGKWKKLI